jgi:hypothetical protein
VTLQIPPATEKVADRSTVDAILREVVPNDEARRAMPASAMPAFTAKTLEKYQPDYANPQQLAEKLKTSPLRQATADVAKQLDAKSKLHELRMAFRASTNEATFKSMLEKEQQTPASIQADLTELADKLRAADKDRNKDPSPRWQAHFDLTLARTLGHLAHVMEYNFVLGNKLRKDSPKLKDPKTNNGWRLVPHDTMQQKDTRELMTERDKLLEKIIKEHPGTPWEVLARRERARLYGLALEEAKVVE